MSSQATFIQSSAVVSRVISGETLIVPVRSGVGDLASIYSLNEVGTRIWQALARPMTPEGLATVVAGEFEIEDETAQMHVTAFLEEMRSAGLVTVES